MKPSAPAPKAAARLATPAADPFKTWDDYFKAHDETPAQLFGRVATLMQSRSFANAEAVLWGYLGNHGKRAEPWMYVWLVKAIEARDGTPAEIKKAIGYAATLAKRTMNPNDLVRVADMMVVRGYYGPVGEGKYQTSIGELVDLAAEKLPAEKIPPMMSVNLATKTKDPKRMADAADRLLALGWPLIDDKMRRDVREQVNKLVKVLRDDARGEEADALAAQLGASEARDVYVQLKWTGEADIDLAVSEPLGATAKYASPRTVFGGAILKNGYGNHPEEVYVCPRGFDGEYVVRVDLIYTDEAKPVTEADLLVITHEGAADEHRETYKVNLAKPEPVVVKLTGGRRKQVLPFIAPPEPPSPVDPAPAPAKAKADKAPAPGPVPAPAKAAKPAAPRPAAPR